MTRRCTDELMALDIRQLAREGHLVASRMSWDSWGNRNGVNTTLHTSVRPDGLWVEWRTRASGESTWHAFNRLLTLERTAMHLGGERVWWHCPRCDRRVAVIFGGRELACRHCWGLTYRCRNETREDSASRQANKLRRKLGWPAGILNDIGGRPKGMHRRTYLRLLNEHARRSELALGYLGQSLDRLSGRLKSRLHC
jgi:hypothetical protein